MVLLLNDFAALALIVFWSTAGVVAPALIAGLAARRTLVSQSRNYVTYACLFFFAGAVALINASFLIAGATAVTLIGSGAIAAAWIGVRGALARRRAQTEALFGRSARGGY